MGIFIKKKFSIAEFAGRISLRRYSFQGKGAIDKVRKILLILQIIYQKKQLKWKNIYNILLYTTYYKKQLKWKKYVMKFSLGEQNIYYKNYLRWTKYILQKLLRWTNYGSREIDLVQFPFPTEKCSQRIDFNLMHSCSC